MGILFKDANGNAIAQLLQMVATDEQVNAAITGYLVWRHPSGRGC